MINMNYYRKNTTIIKRNYQKEVIQNRRNQTEANFRRQEIRRQETAD